MAGLEDLARGLQRFKRTPEQIHITYLEPMRETLLELSEAKKHAEESAKNPEEYRTSQDAGEIYYVDDKSLSRWLSELRGLNLFGQNSESLSRLSGLDKSILFHLYQLPQSEYSKRFYMPLASQIESEATAIAATIQDAEIKELVPLLIYLAQSNTNAISNAMLANRGMPVSSVAPQDLGLILNELVMEEGYLIRAAHDVADLEKFGSTIIPRFGSTIIPRLGIKTAELNPDQCFLISSKGTLQGFLIMYNQWGANSPLYTFPFIQNNAALALNLSERFAAYMGYNAVKISLLLDADARKASIDAGLYLLATLGYTMDTLTGIFVDIIGSNEEGKNRYRSHTGPFLDLRMESVGERSETETLVAASWHGLTINQFLKRKKHNLDNKIQGLVLEYEAHNGKANYVRFNLDKNLVYVHVGGKKESDAVEDTIRVSNEIASFFNGSARQLDSSEMFGEEDNFGIFYCGHSRKVPIALIHTPLSVDTVLSYITSKSGLNEYGKTHVHISYLNPTPEGLATSNLPSKKLTTQREFVITNPKPEEFSDKNKTIPEDIYGATIKFLDHSNTPHLVQYRLENGMPKLTIVQEGSQVGQQTLDGALYSAVEHLWDITSQDCPIADLQRTLRISESDSAFIKLDMLPTKSMLKETYDRLFPNRYAVMELRYRTSSKG